MIRPEDDKFHARDNDPHWNESAWFSFSIPERTTNGMVHFWHRPNMKLTSVCVALWDEQGTELHDCLFAQLDSFEALPEPADMFNFELDNGFSVELLDPLQSYRLRFEGDGCDLDLTWEGLLPVQALHLQTHEDMRSPETAVNVEASDGMSGWGAGHYEQAGRVRGVVSIEGETMEVECNAHRDHTWGPRRLRDGNWLRGGYDFAHGSSESGFVVLSLNSLALDADPFVGTTERVGYGWYMKDGILGNLISGERKVVERAEDGRPSRIVIDAEDSLGRHLHAEGRTRNCLRYLGPLQFAALWCLTAWEFDGQEVWGEGTDYYHVRQARRFLRSLKGSGAVIG